MNSRVVFGKDISSPAGKRTAQAATEVEVPNSVIGGGNWAEGWRNEGILLVLMVVSTVESDARLTAQNVVEHVIGGEIDTVDFQRSSVNRIDADAIDGSARHAVDAGLGERHQIRQWAAAIDDTA